MTLQSLRDQAAQLQQAGRLAEAEPLYRQILAAEAGDFAAAYQLGVIRFGQGRHEEALSLFEGALATRPEAVNGLIMQGLTLQALNRPAKALACYDRTLAIAPGNESRARTFCRGFFAGAGGGLSNAAALSAASFSIRSALRRTVFASVSRRSFRSPNGSVDRAARSLWSDLRP